MSCHTTVKGSIGTTVSRAHQGWNPSPLPASRSAQRPASTAGAGLWANFTEKEISSSPLMSVFVLEQTRPLVMAMSGVTILAALILLGRSGRFT